MGAVEFNRQRLSFTYCKIWNFLETGVNIVQHHAKVAISNERKVGALASGER